MFVFTLVAGLYFIIVPPLDTLGIYIHPSTPSVPISPCVLTESPVGDTAEVAPVDTLYFCIPAEPITNLVVYISLPINPCTGLQDLFGGPDDILVAVSLVTSITVPSSPNAITC